MASRISQFLCLAFFILGIWVCAATSRAINDDLPVSMSARHEQWMAQHGREYKDAIEKELRFNIFRESVEFIESVNSAGDRKYKLDINKFADLTDEEFKAYHTGFRPKPLGATASSSSLAFRYENLSMSDMPPSMDWREKGAVTGVKDQGQCGKNCIYLNMYDRRNDTKRFVNVITWTF